MTDDWRYRMLGYLAQWRHEAARSYKHRLGTIIIFGNTMESIDAPTIRTECQSDNDNRPHHG